MQTKTPEIKSEWLEGITMTRDQKRKWLEALRSGEYEQCVGELKNICGYCCLGVAATAVLGIIDQELRNRLDLSILAPSFLGSKSCDSSIQGVLASMNDGLQGFRRHTFSEIAEFIEANIPACDEVRS